jgi:hypothetical protein
VSLQAAAYPVVPVGYKLDASRSGLAQSLDRAEQAELLPCSQSIRRWSAIFNALSNFARRDSLPAFLNGNLSSSRQNGLPDFMPFSFPALFRVHIHILEFLSIAYRNNCQEGISFAT